MSAWVPAEHDAGDRALQHRVARGLTWSLIESLGGLALQLVVFILLARLLTPRDFGLVALSAVFVGFAQIVVDQGLGDAIVQRRVLTRMHLDTAFWASIATGSLLTVAGLVLAIPIAALLGQPALQPILQVLSLTFVLSAVVSIQVGLLQRELAFRSLALRNIVAIAGGGLVGITMAFLGFGAWALVGQQVAFTGLSVAALWRLSPWRPGLQFSSSRFRELSSFGVNVVGSDVMTYLGRNVDSLLIGVLMGTTPLGLYAVALRILDATGAMLVRIARRLTFPVFSRLQRDPERMRRAYLRVTRAGGALIVPLYVGLALIAPELTVVLFGTRWAESGPVATILFLMGPVLSMQAISGSLLNAIGRPEIVFRFRLMNSLVSIVFVAIAVPFGILAVASAFVIRGYVLLPLVLRWMRIYAGISIREYLAQLRGIAVATTLMAAAVLTVKLGLSGSVQPTVLLMAEIGAGAFAFSVALWIVEPTVVREVSSLAMHTVPGVEWTQHRLRRRSSLDPPADSPSSMDHSGGNSASDDRGTPSGLDP